MKGRMGTRFYEWLATVADQRKEITHARNWIQLAVVITGILAIARFVPGPRELFELQFGAAVLAFAPAVLMGIVASELVQRDRMSLLTFGVCLLVGTALMQVFAAALIALSKPPGSILFAGTFLLISSFYAFRLKAAPRFWFATLPTVVALLTAWILVDTPEQTSVLAVAAPSSLGATLLLGRWGLDSHRARAEQSALRAALQAKVLEDQTYARDQLAERLLRVLEHNHDASSALSGLLMNAQHIREQTRDGSLDPATVHELAGVSESISKGLSRLRQLLEEARRESGGPLEVPEPVRPAELVSTAVEDVTAAWPDVSLEASGLEALDGRRVLVAGGELALARILQNVLTNACQGDGLRGATRVNLRAFVRDDDGSLAIECRDDGPGFTETLLADGPRAFETSKEGGTGLGLYTVRSLARASGGGVEIANADSGGAVITVSLPLERPVL